MFKKFLAIISSLMFICLQTSCGTSAKTNIDGDTTNTSYDNTPCTITLSYWGNEIYNDTINQAISLFKSKYNNINVEIVYSSSKNSIDTISKQLSGSSRADIIEIDYSQLSTLSPSGDGFYNLEQLSNYIDFSNFTDAILDYGRQNDILNAIPYTLNGKIPCYNWDILSKAGVGVPTTWDELFSFGSKVRSSGSYILEANISNENPSAWYLAVIYQQQKSGKTFIDDDGNLGFSIDDIKNALKFYKDLQDNGVIRSTQQINNSTFGTLYNSKYWINGSVSGFIDDSSNVQLYANYLDDSNSLVCGEFLTMNDAKSIGWFYEPSMMLAINKDTIYPEQSAILLNFLFNDPECATIMGTNLGIPTSSTSLKTLKNANLIDNITYEACEKVNNSKLIKISPYFNNQELLNYCNDAIEAVSLGVQSPEEASQGLYANIIFLLDELKTSS